MNFEQAWSTKCYMLPINKTSFMYNTYSETKNAFYAFPEVLH